MSTNPLQELRVKAAQTLRQFKNIPTGSKVTITLSALIAVYSLSVVTSLPGLAIAPILGELQKHFKDASQLQIQMLESLPSLIIIPCVLLAGRLSVNLNKRKLLIWGLAVFFASSILYMISGSIGFMLFNSVLLGVGAGVVIPLSTGLIADYFSGQYRVKQLGIVSAISNLSLVLATMLAGFLAGIGWRYAFLVYCLSLISLIFAFKIKDRPKTDSTTDPESESTPLPKPTTESKYSYTLFGHTIDWPIPIMAFYFFITMVALAIPFNLSLYMSHFHIGSTDLSGTVISVFFLSITMPGFFITQILRHLGNKATLYAAILLTVGMLLFIVSHHPWALWTGTALSGLGYGILQPLIYDKASESVTPIRVTFALALVMAMNYTAIIIYPFFQQLLEWLLSTHSPYLTFAASSVMIFLYVAFQYWNILAKRSKN